MKHAVRVDVFLLDAEFRLLFPFYMLLSPVFSAECGLLFRAPPLFFLCERRRAGVQTRPNHVSVLSLSHTHDDARANTQSSAEHEQD